MGAISKRFVHTKLIHGRHFCDGFESNEPRPDAVLFRSSNVKPITIEVELTLKSFERYRDIILRYRLSKHFDKVIYVTRNPLIDSKLFQAITNERRFENTKLKEGRHQTSTGQFYFTALEELLRDPLTAPITNGEIDFSIIGGEINE